MTLVAQILAALTALEIQISLREIDNQRLAIQALEAYESDKVLTAAQWGAWYRASLMVGMVPIARWARQGGQA